MKTYILLISIIVSIFSCSPSKQDVAYYYEEIESKHISIENDIQLFSDHIYGGLEMSKIDELYNQIVKNIDQAIIDIDKLEPISKDDMLKEASIKLLNNYKLLMEIDFSKIVSNMKNVNSEEDLEIDIESKFYDYANEFEIEKEKFLKKYKINTEG